MFFQSVLRRLTIKGGIVFTSRNARKCMSVGMAVIASIAWMFLGAIPMHAQVAGGSLSGTVTDSTGSVVANAQIAAKNVATGVVATTTSNTSGLYTLTNLIPATYEMTITAAGFSTLVQSGVTLTVGAQQEL